MKRILLFLLIGIIVISTVACSGGAEDSVDGIKDNEATENVDSSADNGTPEATDDSVESDAAEETVPAVESEETEEAVATETQPAEDVAESSYDPTKLSTFGIPEPPFSYSYLGYRETTIGGDSNGNAILAPKFSYNYTCDLETAYNYMKVLQAHGFNGYVPDEIPELSGHDILCFESNDSTLRFLIRWSNEGDHQIWLVDKTKTCSWNDSVSNYVIDGISDFDSYGPYYWED